MAEQGQGKRLKSFPKNIPIIREAETTKSIFFMMRGRAAVVVDGRDVHEIKPGEFFGEIAGILGVKRTATVIAREFSEVMEFQGTGDGELYTFLQQSPVKVLQAFVKGLASKLIGSSKSQSDTIREHEDEVKKLNKAVSGIVAVLEGLAARVSRGDELPETVLQDIAHYAKAVSGVRRGDIRNIEADHLQNLRDVLYPQS